MIYSSWTRCCRPARAAFLRQECWHTDVVPVPLILRCSCAMPDTRCLSVDNLCTCLWGKKITCAIRTQHIKGIIFVFGFHASAKYLTLRHFSHFGTKTFSAPERVQSAVGKISASLQALAPTKQGSYVESNGPEPVHALQQLHL